ncbi:Uncharacterised protein [Vibrio cholerae]|nr:Uncharacterised protein [Vibrio cholerae]
MPHTTLKKDKHFSPAQPVVNRALLPITAASAKPRRALESSTYLSLKK